MADNKVRIGVIGAGMVGVNTALQVQEQIPNAEVHIIAELFNTDTLSTVAPGMFLPGSEYCGLKFTGPNEEITREWIYNSYDYYEALYNTADSIDAGVMQVPGYIFSNKLEEPNPIMKDILPVYRQATEDELKICPGNWKYGWYLKTFVTTSSHYLPWALEKFQRAGGKIHSERVESLESLVGRYDLLMNCSGLGGKYLCNDSEVVPVKGQVFKVKAPWIKMFYLDDVDSCIVPGMDIVTMGGCRCYGNYDDKVNKHISADVWERCTGLVPSLNKAEVIKESVGLRPQRNIIRVEKEVIRKNGKSLKIVHNYGHGGNGVALAPGTAKYAAKLAKEMIAGNTSNITC